MRKQVQKERCTKIMLSKCNSVCHLYDKVQLAAARMLDAEPSVCSFVCNVPVGVDVPADDLNHPSETYTTDFVIQYKLQFEKAFCYCRSPWAGIRTNRLYAGMYGHHLAL